MRLRTGAAVVALTLAGMAIGGVSQARPWNPAPATAECGEDGTVTATPGKVWSPNHKLKTVSLSYDDTSNDGDTLTLTVDSITHDEEGLEKGATAKKEPDWTGEGLSGTGTDGADGTTPGTVATQLRAERLAKPKDGRTYTISVTCTDAGDVSLEGPTTDTATITIFVPHSRKGGGS